jgi:hypothetical protein
MVFLMDHDGPRKAAPKKQHPTTWTATVKQIVDHALRGANDPNVVVGPLLWQPSDGTSNKNWYFILATSEPKRGFRCDRVGLDADQREQQRGAVILELIQQRPPLIIHDMDDEVQMAPLCEILWPGERISGLRKRIEADYAARRTEVRS